MDKPLLCLFPVGKDEGENPSSPVKGIRPRSPYSPSKTVSGLPHALSGYTPSLDSGHSHGPQQPTGPRSKDDRSLTGHDLRTLDDSHCPHATKGRRLSGKLVNFHSDGALGSFLDV